MPHCPPPATLPEALPETLAVALTVAIDGPAGAGKSTVARAVARTLGYTLVDTGAIYRAVALVALRCRTALDDDAQLAAIGLALSISFDFDGHVNQVRLAREVVTRALRSPEVTRVASEISQRPAVRAALLAVQRRLAGTGGAVLEGRDIGTVVFPAAEVKIFLVASPRERARRRHLERQRQGHPESLEEVLAEQEVRDRVDSTREHAPLRQADDALRVDSTGRKTDEVVASIVAAVREKQAQMRLQAAEGEVT